MPLELVDIGIIAFIAFGISILISRAGMAQVTAILKTIKVPKPILVGGLPPELIKDKELRDWILELAKVQKPEAQGVATRGQLGQVMELMKAYGGNVPGMPKGLLGGDEEYK